MNRAVVFAHYDIDNVVDQYVYVYLKELSKISNYIVFVSTADLTQKDIELLSRICAKVIIRDNIGYDFMSYKIGLESFDYIKYDEIIICNDSVYGPFYPLENVFNAMKNKQCDVWGMTSGQEISLHLQSYFLVCKKTVLLSSYFSDFWKNVKVLDNKRKIIETYEVGFSAKLLSLGFKLASYAEYKPVFMEKYTVKLRRVTFYKIFKKIISLFEGRSVFQNSLSVNITHQYWKELLLVSKMPFLKVELLRDNPLKINILDFEDVIKKISDYDVSLIQKHLHRTKK
ncbi:putative glycosyltransferase, fusion protein [Sulfurimonas autotrophica]|uniref:Putative glycosyltransferase, fusion protein n=1 Tax=Sulfurimonas autotrophica (strain ATCC BAA-671 / DSM 16294 / JCM 11897 / OK10) TaxID=563040 RepID=E0UU24_SULAO|nr:putative glycosyltransferase, fusion protein [Sulfurimonas autotrophica]ADN08333.1 putative glycosyltransferase, fusion protein [Sulfurimonas autotrophica DSM 16294]